MRGKTTSEMHDRSGNQSCIPDTPDGYMHDLGKSIAVTGFSGKTDRNDAQDMHDIGSCKIPNFVGAPEAAKLLECVPSTITRQCESGKFPGASKAMVNGIEAWQIPVASLPIHAQQKVKQEAAAALVARCASLGIEIPTTQTKKWLPAEYTAAWEAYERSGAVHKRRAEAALKVVRAFKELVDSGCSIGEAERAVISSSGVSRATLYRYRTAIEGHHRMNWLPFLSPRFKGGRPCAPFTEAAWEYIHGKYLNTSKTPLAVILEEARALALSKGWDIPSDDAVRARMAKEPKWIQTIGREGPKALEQSFPAIRKDYNALALHELWESDGRKADLFCIWPDGTLARPFIIVWREVRSRLVLGAKGYLNPSAYGVLAAFGQAMERTGVAPDFAKIDNGREYAAKSVTGGQSTRYRFNVVPGETPGIMTQVGTKAEWSPPGRGQDKPIESFWRFVADRCDKSPEFEGAYCGRNAVSKPEGFDRSKAIPIAVYSVKLAAVLEFFNNAHRHTGSGMNGRTPMEVYKELSAQTTRQAVDPAFFRLCKMGLASLKPSLKDSSYSLKMPGYGTLRYWSQAIAGQTQDVLSRKHSVYYDLENPKCPVSIYDGNKWLGDASLFEELPFRDVGGERAGEHVKAKNAAMKPMKAAVASIKAAGKLDPPALPAVACLTQLPSIQDVTVEGRRTNASDVRAVPSLPTTTQEEKERLAESERQRMEQMKITDPRRYRMLNEH
ncbi:MAG: transposase domain-containing protein [Candidatus Accumulibacter sp. UW20]|jgi:putative transposase